MKSRTFIIMLAALAVLVTLAVSTKRKEKAPAASASLEAATVLSLDLNAIQGFVVGSGTQTVTIAKHGGQWTVADLWNYPANFDTVADYLRRLGRLRVVDTMQGGEQNLAEFGLASDATNAVEAGLALISFLGDQGKEMGKIALGAPRLSRNAGGMGGFPQGQYVRADDGPVILADENLGTIPRRPADWLDTSLVNVQRDDLVRAKVTREDGTSYEVLQPTVGSFEVPGLGAGEEMKLDGAQLLAGGLMDLNLVSVADPAREDAAVGLDQPITYEAVTREGTKYAVVIGDQASEQNGRFARVQVSYEVPPIPPEVITTNTEGKVESNIDAFKTKAEETAKAALAANSKLAPWIVVLPESKCMNLTLPREQLIGPKAPPTNAPVAEAGAAAPAP